MSTRKETERVKHIQEKCQTMLNNFLRDEDNKYCVDCDAKGPRWASWNIGVFLCIRCAGIHRNLGVHISRVKSVNLDTWTPEQVVSLQQMGNSRARAVYEAQLPDGFRRPQTDSALESFIRAKYEHKKYLAREWVQPPPPKIDWDKEIDEELEEQKRRKKTSSLGISSPAGDKKTTITVKTPLPAPLPKPKANSNSPKTSTRSIEINSSGSSDLLGLSSPVLNGPTTIPLTSSNSASNELNDAFSNFMSAPPIQENSDLIKNSTTIKTDGIAGEISLEKQEADFFSQVTGEKDQAKMTKDSIMALYAKTPAPTNLANFNNINSSGFTTNFNNAQGFMQQPQHQMQQQQQQLQQQQQFGAPNFNNQFGMNLMGQNQQSPQNLMFKVGQTPQMMGGLQGFNNIHPQQQQQSSQQSFAQFPIQAFPTTQNSNFNKPPQQSAAGIGNLNQQFGNINLGNVWQ